jgi:hypothetical protein
MFSSKYLLTIVFLVTGLSVFSTPTGANALVIPSHAHARRAATLLAAPNRRRATRTLKRRLSADADTHILARRNAVPPKQSPAAASDDEDDGTTPPSGKTSSSGGADGASVPGTGMVDTIVDGTANTGRWFGHAAVKTLETGGKLGAETVEGAGSMLTGTVRKTTSLFGDGWEGLKGMFGSHSTVRDSAAPLSSVCVR